MATPHSEVGRQHTPGTGNSAHKGFGMVNSGARMWSRPGLAPKSALNYVLCCPLAVPWEWPPGYHLLGGDRPRAVPQLHLMVALPLRSKSESASFLSCTTVPGVGSLGRKRPSHLRWGDAANPSLQKTCRAGLHNKGPEKSCSSEPCCSTQTYSIMEPCFSRNPW